MQEETIYSLTKKTGLHYSTIRKRLNKGLPYDKVISKGRDSSKSKYNGVKYFYKGEPLSIYSRKNGIKHNNLIDKIRRSGYTIDEALTRYKERFG